MNVGKVVEATLIKLNSEDGVAIAFNRALTIGEVSDLRKLLAPFLPRGVRLHVLDEVASITAVAVT